MEKAVFIVAAKDLSPFPTIDLVYNQSNNIDTVLKHSSKFRIKYLEIDQLRSGWYTPVLPNHFRSGNGPLLALENAYNELTQGNADIVVISGCDNLKSEYTATERHKMMAIYPDLSLPQAYTNLAKLWCVRQNITEQEFVSLSAKLFDNYAKTYAANTGYDPNNLVDKKWFEFITKLFRGVDCANPVADFSGKIVLTTTEIIDKLKLEESLIIEIAGIANVAVNSGPEGINEIVSFSHLAQAYKQACAMACIDFTSIFKQHQAFLEVYTCFPVIPLAFIYESAIATNIVEVEKLLDEYPITVTGGMNLAKAPWNLPVLRSIIVMYHKLLTNPDIAYAGIHGNGGLGEKQGFLLLKQRTAGEKF